MKTESKLHNGQQYIIGGGIAGLATAVYLLQDAQIPATSITIIEHGNVLGGSLDATKVNKAPYIMRGFRMFEETVYSCTLDLMRRIPLSVNSSTTLLDDFTQFNAEVHTHANSRLIKGGERLDARPLTITMKDRLALLQLLVVSEKSLHEKRIDEYFSADFFESDLWYEYATTFSFQPWHGIAEFRRYFMRFLQDAPVLDTMECVRSTRYNQYDSLIMPIATWLVAQGINCITDATVHNIATQNSAEALTVTSIEYTQENTEHTISVKGNDAVYVTLGSMTDGSYSGDMNTAPVAETMPSNHALKLWKSLATQDERFGRPDVFFTTPEKTHWTSFTMNFSDATFFKAMAEYTQNEDGTDGAITLVDSPWLISLSLPKQPHFIDQPDDTFVAWGYGLYPDALGNTIKKPMHQCTGREILTEMLSYIPLKADADAIIDSAEVYPAHLPYITSQFLPHKPGDRPNILPDENGNIALLGQYVEIPDDIVFTVEYSIRSAQMAVYGMHTVEKDVTPIYHGEKNSDVLLNAIKTAFR